MPYAVIDVESIGLPISATTTGRYVFPDPCTQPTNYNGVYLTDIGYVIYSDENVEIKHVDHQVVHKSSVAVEILDVINDDLLKVDKLICHNMVFVYNILLN